MPQRTAARPRAVPTAIAAAPCHRRCPDPCLAGRGVTPRSRGGDRAAGAAVTVASRLPRFRWSPTTAARRRWPAPWLELDTAGSRCSHRLWPRPGPCRSSRSGRRISSVAALGARQRSARIDCASIDTAPGPGTRGARAAQPPLPALLERALRRDRSAWLLGVLDAAHDADTPGAGRLPVPGSTTNIEAAATDPPLPSRARSLRPGRAAASAGRAWCRSVRASNLPASGPNSWCVPARRRSALNR